MEICTFIGFFAVEIDKPFFEIDSVTRGSDNPFDKILFLVSWCLKDDHIASLGVFKAKTDEISEDVFFIFKSWEHGFTTDLKRTEKKDINDKENRCRQKYGLHGVKKEEIDFSEDFHDFDYLNWRAYLSTTAVFGKISGLDP